MSKKINQACLPATLHHNDPPTYPLLPTPTLAEQTNPKTTKHPMTCPRNCPRLAERNQKCLSTLQRTNFHQRTTQKVGTPTKKQEKARVSLSSFPRISKLLQSLVAP